jgi:hypothetical protein
LYLAEPAHRAIAIAPDLGQTWRGSAFRSLEEAEQLVLERCQVRYRAVCVLFAVGDDIRAPVPGATWQPRDMPRVRDSIGAFDAARMPQEKADADALGGCDSVPGRGGREGPCLLYASGDQVVLRSIVPPSRRKVGGSRRRNRWRRDSAAPSGTVHHPLPFRSNDASS